jgi:hypothetical protein
MRSFVLLAALLLAGCEHVNGSVTVDGKPFVVDRCRNGAPFGFAGVQLEDAQGRHLRLVNDPLTGGVQVGVFPGSVDGTSLGECGSGSIQSTRAWAKGHVTLDCELNGHTARGKLDFVDCG